MAPNLFRGVTQLAPARCDTVRNGLRRNIEPSKHKARVDLDQCRSEGSSNATHAQLPYEQLLSATPKEPEHRSHG